MEHAISIRVTGLCKQNNFPTHLEWTPKYAQISTIYDLWLSAAKPKKGCEDQLVHTLSHNVGTRIQSSTWNLVVLCDVVQNLTCKSKWSNVQLPSFKTCGRETYLHNWLFLWQPPVSSLWHRPAPHELPQGRIIVGLSLHLWSGRD